YLAAVVYFHSDLSFAPWYYVAQPMLTAAAIGFAAEYFLRRALSGRSVDVSRRIWFGVAVISLLIPLWTCRWVHRWAVATKQGVIVDPLHDAAIWARDHLPRDAVIGSWNAGNIGSLSNRKTVNLDGLVNDWEFALHDRSDLCRYWRKAGITHLVDVFDSEQALARIPTKPFYSGCTDRLRLIWSDDRYHATWRIEAYRLGDSK